MNVSGVSNETGPPRPWLAVRTLAWREIIRFARQKNRVIGAVATPILFWLLFGLGLDQYFQLSDAGQFEHGFRAYFFPGTLAMILLFTAIFATISIIEDRREGFLQSVLVAPTPRWAMVLGKILGGSIIALVQGLIFLLLALTIPKVHFDLVSLLGIVAMMFVMAIALTALGFVLAWRMDSVQGFHAIMNLLLMPMWLLSSAFFPVPSLEHDVSGGFLHWIMWANPLTYGVSGLRWLMFGDMYSDLLSQNATSQSFWMPFPTTCWIVTLVFAIVTIVVATRVSKSRTTADLL